MKDVTGGNQQATDIELGWLAGIYDGEAYLGFSRQNSKHVRSIRTDIQLVNCNAEIVVKAVGILHKIGINPYIRERIHDKKNWRTNFIVTINKFSHVKRFLDVVGHMLTGEKAARAHLMRELVESRMPKNQSDHYTPKELSLVDAYFERVSAIKIRGNPHNVDVEKVRRLRDYTRSIRAEKARNEDIVRPDARSSEVAEMTARPKG